MSAALTWLRRRPAAGLSFGFLVLLFLMAANNNSCNINIINGTRTLTETAILNTFALNTVALNDLESTFVSEPPFPLAPTFKVAVDAGVLELPFQFTYNVTIS